MYKHLLLEKIQEEIISKEKPRDKAVEIINRTSSIMQANLWISRRLEQK